MTDTQVRGVSYSPADFPPLMVAIPAMQWMWTTSVTSLLQMQLALPSGSQMLIGDGSCSSIAAVRNGLVQQFLGHSQRMEWLLFIDSDMTVHPLAPLRLMSHNVDIVAGACCKRFPP